MASQRGHFFQTPSGTDARFLVSPPSLAIEGNILSIQLNLIPFISDSYF